MTAIVNPNPFAEDSELIHEWFELSYAQYLTVPRSALQSMPNEWQARFVKCLNELDELIDWRPRSGRYWVELRNENGRFAADPLMDYQRGRRRVPLREPYLSFFDAMKWLIETTMLRSGMKTAVILPNNKQYSDYLKEQVGFHVKYRAATVPDIHSPDTHPFAWGLNGRLMQFPNGSELAFIPFANRYDLEGRLRGVELNHLLVHYTVQGGVAQTGIRYADDRRIFFD